MASRRPLYVDHGADFISTHLSQVCADLRMQLIHSMAGKPRGRGKGERIFGSITTELLPTLPGHIPHGNGGSPITPPTLTLSEVDAAIGTWITTSYHRRVHPETGQTPIDRWTAPGWMPRMPESLDELNLLLLQVATPRKVLRDGIHLHGLRYFAITLAPYVGEPVTIRYDPRDLAEIRVYHHEEFLCRADAPEIASVTVSMQDRAAARNQRRRELRQKLTAPRSLAELLTQPAAPVALGRFCTYHRGVLRRGPESLVELLRPLVRFVPEFDEELLLSLIREQDPLGGESVLERDPRMLGSDPGQP